MAAALLIRSKVKKGKTGYLSESPPTVSPVLCRKEEKVMFSIWALGGEGEKEKESSLT